MSIHSIRKFFALTLLYLAGLSAILLLQFRNESTVIRAVGALRVTLSELRDKNQEKSLKNTINAVFPGISFQTKDENPVILEMADGTSSPLSLTSFDSAGDNTCAFHFSGGASLIFSAAGSGEESRLEISAALPEDATALSLPYSAAAGFSVENRGEKQFIFGSEKNSFALKASRITDDRIAIFAGENALFVPYDPESVFTFESALSSPLSEKTVLDSALKALRERVIQAFQAADSSQISEEAVMAFVAEMAQNGRYQEALDAVPSSFKRSSRRTFRTAVYFGNLVEMNRTLSMQLNNDKTLVSQALNSGSLAIFADRDILSYLLIMSGTENVHRLLAIPASAIEDFAPSVQEAAGILNMYAAFLQVDESCSSLLESVLGKCLETIESHCKMEGERILISDSDTEISLLDSIKIGSALMNYGAVSGRQDIAASGRLLVSSGTEKRDEMDLRMLCELYSLLVCDNPFYPRAVILDNKTDPTSPLWVWTAANSVTAENSASAIELHYTFPMLDSHYSLVSGVKSLKSIEIYGMFYRTDPRFESYNSSGYAYSADTRTLLLKTRHKEREEIIRVTLN